MPSAIHEGYVQAITSNRPTTAPSLEEMRVGVEQMLNDPSATASIEEFSIGALKVDRVRAPGGSDDTTIVHCHGGGYVLGSRISHRAFAARLSASTRATVLLPEYRLAPEHVFPAALEDLLSLIAWIGRGEAGNRRLVLSGDSAGGGLVIAAFLALKESRLPLPTAGVCLSPWVDLTMSGDSARPGEVDDPLLDSNALSMMAGLYAPGKLDSPLASPLRGDLAGLPPLLIMAGTREILVDDARRLARRASESGVVVDYHEEAGLSHAWPVMVPSAPESIKALSLIGRFIAAQPLKAVA